MISDVNLHQQKSAEPEQVQVTEKASKQTVKLGRQKSRTLQSDQGQTTASSTQGASQRLKAVKQLSFRIDDATHHRISLAAQRAGKSSINAWMEEVVSAAADDVLERGSDAVINSAAIQSLLEDSDYAVRLIDGVTPYLRDSSPPTVFQFSHALKKLLIGWDMMSPFIEEATEPSSKLIEVLSNSCQKVTKLAAAVVPLLVEADSVTVLRYNAALKKLLLGFAAVAPFVKEKKTDNLLEIAVVVESLLEEIRHGSSSI